MPQIIPRQFTPATTNIQPGIGMSIGQGLQDVAGLLGQIEKGRRQQDEIELQAREKEEKSKAIDGAFRKQSARQQAEYDIRTNNEPEDYIDLLEKWENDYDKSELSGKSKIYSESFLINDKVNKFNSMNSMGTAMRSDILERSKTRLNTRVNEAISAGNTDMLYQALDAGLSDGIRADVLDGIESNAIAAINQNRVRKMDTVDRIDYLNQIAESGGEVPGVDVAKELSYAVSEYNTQRSADAVRSSVDMHRAEAELLKVFMDGSKTRSDAIAVLDSLGYDKNSAVYINSMESIDAAYGTKTSGGALTDEQKMENEILMARVDVQIDTAKERISKDNLEDMMAEDKEGAMRLLEETSTEMRNLATQIMQSPKPDYKKLVELQSIQEQILSRVGGNYDSSLSSRVYDGFKSINVSGKGRVFTGPYAARDEMVYRQAMLDGLASIGYEEKHSSISDGDRLNSMYYDLEKYANAQIAKQYGDTGTTEELAKKYDERFPNTSQITQRTPEQTRATLESAIMSGQIPRDNETALNATYTYLPESTPDDVRQMEAERLVGIGMSMSNLDAPYQDIPGGLLSVEDTIQSLAEMTDASLESIGSGIEKFLKAVGMAPEKVKEAILSDEGQAALNSLANEILVVQDNNQIGLTGKFLTESYAGEYMKSQFYDGGDK